MNVNPRRSTVVRAARLCLALALVPLSGTAAIPAPDCDDCAVVKVNLYGPLGRVRGEARDPDWRRVEKSGGRLEAAESGSAVVMDLDRWQLPGYADRDYDVLKSAGHLFFNAQCELMPSAAFWPKGASRPVTAHLVAIGFAECPFHANSRYRHRMKRGKKRILVPTDDDWAILITPTRFNRGQLPGLVPLPVNPSLLRFTIRSQERQGRSVDVRVIAHTRQHGTVDGSLNRGTIHPYPGQFFGARGQQVIAHNAAMELGNSGGSLVVRMRGRFFDVGTQSMRWSHGAPTEPFELFKNPNFAVANHQAVQRAMIRAGSYASFEGFERDQTARMRTGLIPKSERQPSH